MLDTQEEKEVEEEEMKAKQSGTAPAFVEAEESESEDEDEDEDASLDEVGQQRLTCGPDQWCYMSRMWLSARSTIAVLS